MYNDLFSIGPLTFHTYGLMTAIGIIAAYLVMGSRAKKKQFTAEESDQILGLIISCLIFGYLGSKLLYILTILPKILKDPALLRNSITDGWVIFGGLLGGMFGAWLFCRIKHLDSGRFFDLAFPGVALAQAFGRIGCFFAGCCYGTETNSAFSIVFKNSDYAPNHVHLVPTQLLSSLGDFLLFFFLIWYEKKKQKRSGELAALYLIFYSAGRFILEFWRGDLARGAVGTLSTSQFIGIFTLAVGVVLFFVIRSRTKNVSATEEEEAATDEAEGATEEDTVTEEETTTEEETVAEEAATDEAEVVTEEETAIEEEAVTEEETVTEKHMTEEKETTPENEEAAQTE